MCIRDRHRSYEDSSYIVISEIFDSCGYKQTRHKPKIFYEIIKCLLFLNESNLINITSDFDIYITGYGYKRQGCNYAVVLGLAVFIVNCYAGMVWWFGLVLDFV